jgi:hypothetical protein
LARNALGEKVDEEKTNQNSGYYGCFLIEGNQYHDEHYDKYEKRAQSLIVLMESLKASLEDSLNIKNILMINYQNIYVAMGRYFNDVIHYKCWHRTPLTHRSKVAAHMIKWIRLNPFFSYSIPMGLEWMKFSEEIRVALLNINAFAMTTIIEYIANAFGVFFDEEKFRDIQETIDYYTSTDTYNERMALLWFKEILK